MEEVVVDAGPGGSEAEEGAHEEEVGPPLSEAVAEAHSPARAQSPSGVALPRKRILAGSSSDDSDAVVAVARGRGRRLRREGSGSDSD